MYDLVLLASRPSDWTHEQFIEWWRGPHANLTRRLPGLRAWRHIEIDRAFEPRSEGWDGISILGFDSPKAVDEAFASEEWRDAVAQVGTMRGRRIAVLGYETLMIAPPDEDCAATDSPDGAVHA
jgi:uncharacterized protein (TIGR02118 family)